MDTLLNLELSEARRHDMERTAQLRRRYNWPDDGLPARGEEPANGSLHPAAVLARIISWR